jgi:hypothetical protein
MLRERKQTDKETQEMEVKKKTEKENKEMMKEKDKIKQGDDGKDKYKGEM